MKVFFFAFFGMFFISSCGSNVDDDYFNKICKGSENFSFLTNGRDAKNVFSADTFRALRPLNMLSDTFFLRIDHAVDTTEYIFEYSFYKSKQTFKVFKFLYRRGTEGVILFDKSKDDLKNFTTVYNFTTARESFLPTLEKNGILKLPDCDMIPDYYIAETGADDYQIQYSNKCMYRLFWYGDPYLNRKNIKQAKDLTDFLDYLKSEFDFK